MIHLGNLGKFPELGKSSVKAARTSIESALKRPCSPEMLDSIRQAMAHLEYKEIAGTPLTWNRVNSEGNIESVSFIQIVCAAFVPDAAREILQWRNLHVLMKQDSSFKAFITTPSDASLEAAFDAKLTSIVGIPDNGFVAQYKILLFGTKGPVKTRGKKWKERSDGHISWLAKRLPLPDVLGGLLTAKFALELVEYEPDLLRRLESYFFGPLVPAVLTSNCDLAFDVLHDFASKEDQQWISPSCSDVRAFLPNLILEGVPGTGKTYALARLREFAAARRPPFDPLCDAGSGRFAMTMHPATTYEDFVEGLRPVLSAPATTSTVGNFSRPTAGWFIMPDLVVTYPELSYGFWRKAPAGSAFEIRDGFLVRVCAEAVCNPDSAFVVLLDELNRCNVPKVMGELLTTMEKSKRAKWNGTAWDLTNCQVVQLPQSQRQFFMPDNVFIIGTMNSSDRSIMALDSALRRRFEFVRLKPLVSHAKDAPERLRKHLERLNAWAMKHVGDQAQLGHSYLMNMEYDTQSIQHRLNRSVLPDLAESITLAGLAADLSEEAAASTMRKELVSLGVKVEEGGERLMGRLVLTILEEKIDEMLAPPIAGVEESAAGVEESAAGMEESAAGVEESTAAAGKDVDEGVDSAQQGAPADAES